MIDIGFRWSIGAPTPYLIADSFNAFLVCSIEPSAIPPAEDDETYGVIRFSLFRSLRFGMPNDEALDGHPLWGKGLDAYEAHIVHNSEWLEEHIRMNRVHPNHADADWRKLTHYILAFHDEMFECLAESFDSRIVRGRVHNILKDCADLLR